MGISLTNETKSNVSLSNEAKPGVATIWNDATNTWDEYNNSTWANAKLVLTKETKSKISLSNESK